MIAVRGASSAIAQALQGILPATEKFVAIDRNSDMPLEARRYLFCAGILRPKTIAAQDAAEMAESFFVNAAYVIQDCERILASNEHARICVIGSESGFAWSYDGAYAAAKAALHRYVETKQLMTEHQQLVCVAPGIIADAGMTKRRMDHTMLVERRMAHPKRRFLKSIEVARTVHHLLYVDEGYISGVVLRMNGGAHTQ